MFTKLIICLKQTPEKTAKYLKIPLACGAITVGLGLFQVAVHHPLGWPLTYLGADMFTVSLFEIGLLTLLARWITRK